MTDTSTLKETDLGAFIAELTELPHTESVKFVNNTSGWSVEYWLYEFRQTTNLPPPSGFEAYTGIVVGGKNVAPGQEQVAMLFKRVQGNFADCGAWKLRHTSGKTQETFNFNDKLATPGRFFLRTTFTLGDAPNFGENAVGWEATYLYSDGTLERDEGIILPTLT